MSEEERAKAGRDSTSAVSIGKRIKALRENAGLTQEQLGEKLFLSREWVNKIERGGGDMKTGSIIALAEALHTTCDYLLLGVRSENVNLYRQTGLEDASIESLKRYSAEKVEGRIRHIQSIKSQKSFIEKMACGMQSEEEYTEFDSLLRNEEQTYEQYFFGKLSIYFINEFIQNEKFLKSIAEYSNGILDYFIEPREERALESAGARFILSKHFDDFLMSTFRKGKDMLNSFEEE